MMLSIYRKFSYSAAKGIWSGAQLHKPHYGKVQNVTLIPGIGIGP